ncbi:MAG: AAA family ATPase [Gammaproteobacteria bacterium]|nr:AAA family ATPase [Gammaproteobacteria bacterium]
MIGGLRPIAAGADPLHSRPAELDVLSHLIDAEFPLVAVETHEEPRLLVLLRKLAAMRKRPLFAWSASEGLRRLDLNMDAFEEEAPAQAPVDALRRIRAHRAPAFYVLLDFHPYLDHPEVVRLLKDLAQDYGRVAHTLVLASHALSLPPELKRLAGRYELPMPDSRELEALVREEANRWSRGNAHAKVKTDSQTLGLLVRNLRGLSTSDARTLIRSAIVDDGAITEADLRALNRAKFELLDMEGVLSFEHETARFTEVGGLAALKTWLGQRAPVFHRETGTEGLDAPKGTLLVGVQGGGKSLAAKAVAGLFGAPLLRLDFGALYNKYHGESERNLRQSLKLAEQMAPCVLWMDEIEKGVSQDANDGGTSRRMLGSLLTWMAENNSVFVVATANDIHQLPPELIRKGRLDEIFFVDLPDSATRAEIFAIHLAKRGHQAGDFDCPVLAGLTEGFSGAEIEQAVVGARYAAVAAKRVLDMELLRGECQRTQPLSVVMAEPIAELRAWAKGRTVPAG